MAEIPDDLLREAVEHCIQGAKAMTHDEMKAVAEDLRLASYAVVEDEDGHGIGDYELLPAAATAIDALLAELEAAKARIAVLEGALGNGYVLLEDTGETMVPGYGQCYFFTADSCRWLGEMP